jgi:hypothetical protein
MIAGGLALEWSGLPCLLGSWTIHYVRSVPFLGHCNILSRNDHATVHHHAEIAGGSTIHADCQHMLPAPCCTLALLLAWSG